MSVRTVNVFKSDVRSVPLSHVDHATDSLLCQCSVLIKTTPLFNQSFFQMVEVTDLAAVDSLLQNAPNRIIHRIQFGTVQSVADPAMGGQGGRPPPNDQNLGLVLAARLRHGGKFSLKSLTFVHFFV